MESRSGDAVCRPLSHFTEVAEQPLDKILHSGEMLLIPVPPKPPMFPVTELTSAKPEMLSLSVAQIKKERKRTRMFFSLGL